MPPAEPEALVVSVVVPAFNAAPTLTGQLDALSSQTFDKPFEVIISDNGSTDSTVELAQSYADRLHIRVVDSSDRRGAGHARNVGTAAARAPLVAYCDADDIVDRDWLAAVVGALAAGDGPIVVGGALEHDLLNDPETDWRGQDGADSLPRPLRFLPSAISANCATSVEVWRSIGGWREDYEHGGDDVDFSWRAQLAGYTVRFVPGAVVHYRRRDSLRGLAKQVFDYAQADVRLFREYRALGAARPTARRTVRAFAYPVTRLPYLAMSKHRRGLWLTVAASTAGHLAGSWRHRTLYV